VWRVRLGDLKAGSEGSKLLNHLLRHETIPMTRDVQDGHRATP
jgi:hypothetical protein